MGNPIYNKIVVFLFLAPCLAYAQNTEDIEVIDLSKPTNIYTRVNNNLENVRFTDGSSNWGYRLNFNYAFEKIQTTIEAPFLYSDKSNKFGLGDFRLRTYYVPYIDYSKTFGGFGISLDVFFPTGDRENNLGSERWSLSPGIVAGFIFSDNYSFFPNISYRYQFNADESLNPDAQHGLTILLTNSIVLNKKAYLMVVPMFLYNDVNNPNQDDYGFEFEYNYMLKFNKLQIGAFTRQLFNSKTQSYRIFARVFI